MSNSQNGFQPPPTTRAFVLNDQTPDDVGRAMIEGGLQKQPFYIFDLDEACRRIQHMKKMMPRVKIFYAMKSNDTDMMLKLAISQGTGFDCASPGEIYRLRKLNVPPTSIIYAMPTKTPEQMEYARNSGVRHTTFDTSYELKKFTEHWPDARLLIRVRVDSVCSISLGEKFGCDFETEAFHLLEEAARLGINVVGVAFHVGSGCSSIQSYVQGLKYARALFDHEAKAGRVMKIVDIGGGFQSDRTDCIDQVSKLINAALEELFPYPDIQIISEPGRYLCDSAFTMYCSINNVRKTLINGKPRTMIYLNDGYHGCLNRIEKWHTVNKFKRSTDKTVRELEEVTLWGPTCDSDDRVMKNFTVLLPRCSPHDWIVFRGVGAYTISFSTRFSRLEIPLIRSVVSQELWYLIKDMEIFKPDDFLIDPDIRSPLPVTIPPILLRTSNEHTNIPTLEI